MQGFFKKKETRSLLFTQSKKLSCFSCGLYRHCDSPKMEPYGAFKKKIMIIGEAPGEKEDHNGKPWQGKTGRLLQRTLESLGIDLFEDCVSLNSVNCRPPENRNPSKKEVACCRDVKVLPAINDYQPKMILILGGLPLITFLQDRWKSTSSLGGIMKWAGNRIPDQDYKTWVCPTFHPSFVERSDSAEVSLVWEQHLKRAIEIAKEPLPIYKEPNIRFIDNLEEINEIVTDTAAFDYETTGKKPEAPGHRIVCCSIAYSPDDVVAFMMPGKKSEREPFIKFLQSNIRKIASNLKFEDNWTNVRLNSHVANWYHDTMQEAHILDNRTGITGLKFQAYLHFGIISYDEEEKEFLKSKNDESSNAFNRIFDLLKEPGGKEQLLKYCAVDSIMEYRLAMQQIKERNELA